MRGGEPKDAKTFCFSNENEEPTKGLTRIERARCTRRVSRPHGDKGTRLLGCYAPSAHAPQLRTDAHRPRLVLAVLLFSSWGTEFTPPSTGNTAELLERRELHCSTLSSDRKQVV